jgi:hypothetical protein
MKPALLLLAVVAAIALAPFYFVSCDSAEAAKHPFSFWKTASGGAPAPTPYPTPAPNTISNLAVWLKADALGLSDGTAVSSWTDSSGNGNHAVQATGTRQPIYKTSIINGKATVRFDGSDDVLVAPTTLGTAAHTVFTFAKNITLPNSYNPVDAYNNNAAAGSGTLSGVTLFVRSDGGGAVYPPGGATAVDPAGTYSTFPFLHSFTFATGTNWISYHNQQLEAQAVTSSYPASTHFQIGGQFTASITRGANADVAEWIGYSRVLTTTERQGVEQYLLRKYHYSALQFNGSTQYVSLTGNPVNPNADFTIEAWIKVNSAATSNAIFSASSGSNYWMLVNRNDGNGLCWQVDTGGGASFVGGSSATVSVADGWTHVALTRSGNTFSFYKNGSLLKTGTYSGTSGPTANQRIAQLPIGTNYFNGWIDEVRTWSVARSAQEISDWRFTVMHGDETGLTSYYRFEEGSGTSTTADWKTSGTAGTLVGSPTWSTTEKAPL